MEPEELIQLLKQVEEKGIGRDALQEKIKVPYQILELYSRSGPVPVTIGKKLKALLEAPA